MLESLVPGIATGAHPKDLSEGQRLAVALALVLAPEPPLVLLDEPTRGLDYGAKERLAQHLRDLAARGHSVVVATHDVELVAEVADRVVVLADGEVITDGPRAIGRVPLGRTRLPGGPDPRARRVADGRRGRRRARRTAGRQRIRRCEGPDRTPEHRGRACGGDFRSALPRFSGRPPSVAVLHPRSRLAEPGSRRRRAVDHRRDASVAPRGGARRVQRRRHRRQGRRPARRARRPAAPRCGFLPAALPVSSRSSSSCSPPATSSGGTSDSCSEPSRCSPRPSSPAVSGRGCRSRCSLPPGWATAPAASRACVAAANCWSSPPTRRLRASSTGSCSTCGSGRSAPARRRRSRSSRGRRRPQSGAFRAFHFTTSLGFDLPRAALNAVLVLVVGRPVIAASAPGRPPGRLRGCRRGARRGWPLELTTGSDG